MLLRFPYTTLFRSLYAGSIMPGWVKLEDGTEKDVTIIDAFEAVGACARGLMSKADVDQIERAICPGERSEERRVGKECRSRGTAWGYKERKREEQEEAQGQKDRGHDARGA